LTGYGPTAQIQQPTLRLRRRRRPLLWLTVVIVIILIIAGIGDQVAKSYAQNRIAQQIQQSGLNAKPSVTIEGWPFLTQILAHNLKTVDISASNVTADSGKLPFSFTAKATGVHLNSSFSGATVDHITGQAIVPFSSVASLFPIPGVTISADPADGPDAVKADAGIAGSVTGIVKQTSPSKVSITLNSASGIAAVFSQLSEAITITIPQLPAGLVVRSVSVTSQGIVATASASNTTLTE
jgi:LmeA-like phospholipid-binding